MLGWFLRRLLHICGHYVLHLLLGLNGLLLEGNVTYGWIFGSLDNRLHVVSGSWCKWLQVVDGQSRDRVGPVGLLG